jgi:hypothetical protein
MKNIKATAALILTISLMIGCAGTGRSPSGIGREAEKDAAMRHAETVDSLVPAENGYGPAHLRAVIEAVRTVRPDIPPDELPVVGKAVRRVLQGMSQSELNRVKAILPSIQKRRKERGDD